MAIVLAVAGCAVDTIASRALAVIDGAPCDEDQLAAAAAVLVTGRLSSPGSVPLPVRSIRCSGVLIAADVVLTAAHCTDPSLLQGPNSTFADAVHYVSFTPDLTDFAVSTPREDPPPLPPDAVAVRRMIGQPSFDAADVVGVAGLDNLADVGLLLLEREVTGVEPAPLLTATQAAAALVVGAEVEIAGWGHQTSDPAGAWGRKTCARSAIHRLGDHEMQVGTADSPRKCRGDSGAPTFLQVGGLSVVAGVTSRSYEHADCSDGDIDTRVDAWLGWIERTICEEGAGTDCPPPAEGGCALAGDDPRPLPLLPWLLICLGALGARRSRA